MRSSSPASILIVEDERLVAKDIQQTLAGFGYDAFGIATSADDAIAKVTDRCPDLVLMDIRIKGKRDGIETAGILRERFGIPVVYLTAHADDATIQRAKQTEPHGYLMKPVTAAELRSAVEVSLYKHAMESQLRKRERWFSTTLQAIADAVISVDLEGRITFMNPAAERLVGHEARDVLGRPANEILQLADTRTGNPLASPFDRVLREGRAVELREAMLRGPAQHETRFISDSAAPVVDDERTIGAVMVFRDITEQRQLHKRIEQLATLGTVAAGVAHELGNPLTAITGNTEYIESELERLAGDLERAFTRADPLVTIVEGLREPAQELLTAARRMAKIVSDIQSFSQPPQASSAMADVGQAMRSALSSTTRVIHQRARLFTELGALPPVRAEESRLEQIFVNLLVNASQSIEAGRPEDNEIRVTGRTDHLGRAVVEVRDSGQGIPPAVLQRIFDPFFTTKPVGVGTGLGLSICNAIVAALGGELEVESELGRGTAFRVVLPGAPVEHSTRVRREQPAVPESPRGRILAIDDEAMVLSTIARLLASQHDVTCLESARQALALLERGERFDLVLCDVMMPGMNGLELFEALLRNHPDHARRVVFVTGGAADPAIQEILRSMRQCCVEKPFTKAGLLATVREQLERARESRSAADAS